MTPKQIDEFIKSQGITLTNGQVMLTKQLNVFKKVLVEESRYQNQYHAIANLVIPTGAVVNLCEDRYGDNKKLRADQAYCHSIVGIANKKQYDTGYSKHRNSFVYQSGKKTWIDQ